MVYKLNKNETFFSIFYKKIILFVYKIKLLLPSNALRFSVKNYIVSILTNHVVFYPSPVSLSYAWSFGFLATITLVIQLISGLFLSMMGSNPVKCKIFLVLLQKINKVKMLAVSRFLPLIGSSLAGLCGRYFVFCVGVVLKRMLILIYTFVLESFIIFKRMDKKIEMVKQLKILLNKNMKEIFFKKQYLKNLKNKFVLLNSSLNDLFNYKIWHSDSAVANQLEFQEIEFFFTFNMLVVILSTLVFVLWALCVLLTSFSKKSKIRAKELNTSTVLEELLRGFLVFVISVGPSLLLHMLCVILLGQEVNLEVADNTLPSEDPNSCLKQEVLNNATENDNVFTLGLDVFFRLFSGPDESALPVEVDASRRPYLADIVARDVENARLRTLAAIAETESKAALNRQYFSALAEEDADRAAVHEAGEMIIETLAEEAAAGDSVNAEKARLMIDEAQHRQHFTSNVAPELKAFVAEKERLRVEALNIEVQAEAEAKRRQDVAAALKAHDTRDYYRRKFIKAVAIVKVMNADDRVAAASEARAQAEVILDRYSQAMIADDADARLEAAVLHRQLYEATVVVKAFSRVAENVAAAEALEAVNASTLVAEEATVVLPAEETSNAPETDAQAEEQQLRRRTRRSRRKRK